MSSTASARSRCCSTSACKFAEAADAAGIYCLHIAEHHATPLNMVPVPGVYLGALARTTKRMRLGPLVYLLPLYSPLRMIEEICMLDHLSHGRLEVGVGRGVSPYELQLPQGRARRLARHLRRRVQLHQRRPDDRLSHLPGQALRLRERADSVAAIAAAASAVLVCVVERDRRHLGRRAGPAFRDAWAYPFRQSQHRRLPRRSGETRCTGAAEAGVCRRRGRSGCRATFSSPTATRTPGASPRRRWTAHVAHVKWLATRHGDTGLTSRLNLSFGASYEDAVADGTVIAGTPEQVLIEIERQAGMLGINYLLSYLFLGNMTLADALRSLDLFSTEVMPHLAKL